jgi:conjugal transfer/entry exclusion protein
MSNAKRDRLAKKAAEDDFEYRRDFRPDAITWLDNQYGAELESAETMFIAGWDARQAEVDRLRGALEDVAKRLKATSAITQTIGSLSRLSYFEVGLVKEAHGIAQESLAAHSEGEL